MPAVKPCRLKLSWLLAACTGSEDTSCEPTISAIVCRGWTAGEQFTVTVVGPFWASLAVSGALLTSFGASATGTALLVTVTGPAPAA